MNLCYFPGANTGDGFCNHFAGIAHGDRPHYTYVLKGGPGVGKSTLMKTVAARAADAGITVEEFHCASDPDSLDAVRLVERGVILLDGTAPHTMDPAHPGISGETVNLGIFKNTAAFAAHKDEVEAIAAENRRAYTEAYAALAAAKSLQAAAMDAATVDRRQYARGKALADKEADGSMRTLFLCSATPRGTVDFLSNYADAEKIEFAGFCGGAALDRIARESTGKNITRFADFIDPADTFALWLPKTRTLLCRTAAEENGFAAQAQTEIERLTSLANASLSVCLALHDKIEAIYRPFVDYAAVDGITKTFLDRLSL